MSFSDWQDVILDVTDFSIVATHILFVMIDWILQNKEWLFSGVGLSILSLGGTMLFKKKAPKPNNVEHIHSSGSVTIYQASDNAQIRVETNVKRSPAVVHVVDVSIVESDDHHHPSLDIKLRNAGDEVAFVKCISFKTLSHWDIHTDSHPSLKGISATYGVMVSEVSCSISQYKLSHEIRPQETDRIQVRLGTNYSGDPNGLSIFLLEADIAYNEGTSKTSLPGLLLNILPPELVQASYFPGYAKGTVTRNKAVADAVFALQLGELVVQDGILEALDSWRQAPAET